MQRKLLILFLTFVCCIHNSFGQASWPMVVKNSYFGDYPSSISSLLIRNAPNTSATILTSLINSSTATLGRLVATSVVSGGSTTSPTNLQTTSSWYQVDLPGTTGPNTGYCAAGAVFSNSECGAQYITVNATSVFIRTSPGSGNVTIGGVNALVYSGQGFAVCNTFSSAGVTYFEIALLIGRVLHTLDCSQNTGWVQGNILPSTVLVTSSLSGNNGLATTTAPSIAGITFTKALRKGLV